MQYNPQFLSAREILAPDVKAHLNTLDNRYPLGKFLESTRSYDEMRIDFVYTSGKIEGNTYSRLDTDCLIRMGQTAGGKKFSDAVMLMNLRDGFDIALTAQKTAIDVDYVCSLHKILMAGLLPSHEQGLARSSGVRIAGARYQPPSNPGRLMGELKFIMDQAGQYADPFERGIYLHCNLAYLQYFADGNKRTARMVQTAAMAQGGVTPLFFHDALIRDYIESVIHYYETGSYERYAKFFIANHELVIDELTQDNDDKIDWVPRM
jgi:Fic family protein